MPSDAGARTKIFRKARPPIGSRPGTLAAPPGSPPPQIRVFAYAPDGVQEHAIGDVEELEEDAVSASPGSLVLERIHHNRRRLVALCRVGRPQRDAVHEMSVGLIEIYLSNVGQRTNEIMKMLTLMASIFIPLTFVAGVYGMKVEHMPELHRRWGYLASLAIMVAIAASMLLYFRRRGWLGRGSGRQGR